MSSTQELITTAVKRFVGEVPALANLKLVFELELQAKGDTQMFRVELPGPKISKELADDAKVTVHMDRPHFNMLAVEGTLKQYHAAWDEGHIKASGSEPIQKLVGQVVVRQEARSRLKKAH